MAPQVYQKQVWKSNMAEQQRMGLLTCHPCIRQYLLRTRWAPGIMLALGYVGDGRAFRKLYVTSWSLSLLTCKTSCWD